VVRNGSRSVHPPYSPTDILTIVFMIQNDNIDISGIPRIGFMFGTVLSTESATIQSLDVA
jgi:hypothetical protein